MKQKWLCRVQESQSCLESACRMQVCALSSPSAFLWQGCFGCPQQTAPSTPGNRHRLPRGKSMSSTDQILFFSCLNQTSAAPYLPVRVGGSSLHHFSSSGSPGWHHCCARAGKMLCSSSLLQAQQAARFILQASHPALSNLITRCWALYSP